MSETFNRITGKPTVKPVAGKVVRSGQVQASSTPPAAVPTGQTATTAPQAAVSQQQSQAGGATAKPTLTNATAGIDVKQQGVAQSQPSNIVASSPDDGGKKFVSMAELMERTSPYKPPTPEELEKERKRQKRQSMWAAIGDGVSALANLYFTSKGAPNSYSPQTSMSAKLKEQFDKIDAERKANTARYQEAYMRAKQYDNMNEQNEREYRRKVFSDMRQAKKDATMLEMKARELEMKGELNEAQKLREQAEIKRVEAQTGKIIKETEWIDALNNAKVGNLNASTNAHNANATNSYAQANKANRSDGGKNGGSTKAYGTFNGKAYANAQDYNKAVIKEAKRLGIPLVYDGERDYATGKMRNQKLRTIAGLAAEVEARTQPATPKGNVTKPVTRKPADKKYQHTRSLGL
ncbi:hypothetical protein [Lancefieldella rimae]|uniref:hypothetical protein n=1 Tax=Lancefieldella rimae TaxID=1383 RepID=UPI003A90A98E